MVIYMCMSSLEKGSARLGGGGGEEGQVREVRRSLLLHGLNMSQLAIVYHLYFYCRDVKL